MHRWTNPAQTPTDLTPCVATLGNFDGVHRGHKAVLAALRQAATRHHLPEVVVTFDPHPLQVLRPDSAPELIAPGRLRDDLLEDTGIDGLLVIDFTPQFATTSAEQFVRHTLIESLRAQCVVVGADTRFGAGNQADVGTLQDLGRTLGLEVVVVDDAGDSQRWSSTLTRQRLLAADVAGAAEILGRPHRVVGEVVHGHHRGRELGFPTANLSPDSLGCVPAEGVYAGWLTRLDLADGEPDRTMPAAISIGTNPTFVTNGNRTVEAYVLDRDDLDLYGEEVLIEFVQHIRPTLKFESIDELLVAMRDDVAQCRRILTTIVPT